MATSKDTRMCVVKIGFDDYLMPAAVGMKVAELMQQARPVRTDYLRECGNVYSLTDDASAEVNWTAVQPKQVLSAEQGRLLIEEAEKARAKRVAEAQAQLTGAGAA